MESLTRSTKSGAVRAVLGLGQRPRIRLQPDITPARRLAGRLGRAQRPGPPARLGLGRRPGLAAGLAAGALAFLATACGTSPSPSSGTAVPSGAEPSPQGVQILRDHKLPSGTLGTSCVPQGSLRPTSPLPPPGHMPAGPTMAAIEKRGYLRVGVDQTIDLTSYRNPLNGQLEGFDVDVARQIAQAIFGNPDKIQFKAITSAQRIHVIQKGQVDIVVDSMTITCARQRKVDFSTDYLNAGQQVLVPINSKVTGIGDLGGKKVCADTGTTSIQQIQAQPSHPIPVAANNWTDCLVMLEQGQVAAISTDNSVLAGLAAQDPQTKLVGPLFTVEQHGIAISQSAPDLVRFVNAVLEQMRTDGTWTKLYKTWFGTRLGPVPAPPTPLYRS
jgi:polar amino acid transport system substrate-binding protein